jgi:hypothetical protein
MNLIFPRLFSYPDTLRFRPHHRHHRSQRHSFYPTTNGEPPGPFRTIGIDRLYELHRPFDTQTSGPCLPSDAPYGLLTGTTL